SPANTAAISTAIVVSASAADAGGIARVELLVGGVLKATDTEAPYAFDLDPASYPDGNQVLVARAYDTAGNAASSTAVTVRVALPPTATVTSPAEGVILTGMATVTADAADNTAVTRVDFYVDTTLAGSDTTPPWSATFDS